MSNKKPSSAYGLFVIAVLAWGGYTLISGPDHTAEDMGDDWPLVESVESVNVSCDPMGYPIIEVVHGQPRGVYGLTGAAQTHGEYPSVGEIQQTGKIVSLFIREALDEC